MTWIVLGPYMIRLCDVSVVETEEIAGRTVLHIHMMGGSVHRFDAKDGDRDRLVYALHAAELEPVASGLVLRDPEVAELTREIVSAGEVVQ